MKTKINYRTISYKTKRLIIRPLELSDYEAWVDAYVNGYEKSSKWDRSPKSLKKCDHETFTKLYNRLNDLASKDDYYRFTIFEKDTLTILGEIDFDIYVRSTHQFANFGYFIFNRYWGLGYGLESSSCGLKIGFKELKLNRLEAAINLDNKKSLRLVEAIGMRKEGLKKRYWYENGHWTDHLIYVANPEDINLKGRKPYG